MKKSKGFGWASKTGFAVLIAALAGVSLVAYNKTMHRPALGLVMRVVDGDTLVLSDGRRLRLLGINTPEHGEAIADRAKAFVQDFVSKGGLRLKTAGKRDYYHRVLGDLIRGTHSLCQALVARGLAHVMLIPRYDHARAARLLAAQAKARAAHLGIWHTSRYKHSLHITMFKTNTRKAKGRGYMRVANIADHPVDIGNYFLSNGKAMARLPHCRIPVGETIIISMDRGRNRCRKGGRLRIALGRPGFFGRGKAKAIIIKSGPGHEIVDKVRAHRL